MTFFTTPPTGNIKTQLLPVMTVIFSKGLKSPYQDEGLTASPLLKVYILPVLINFSVVPVSLVVLPNLKTTEPKDHRT